MRPADIIFSTFMLLVCGFLAFCMAALPEGSMINQTRNLNPFSFPKLITIVLFVCSAIVLAKALLGRKDATGKAIFDGRGLKYALLQVVLAGVYIVSLKYIGFIVSTLAVMFVANLVSREKRTGKDCLEAIAFSLALTLAAYVGFRLILNVNLP